MSNPLHGGCLVNLSFVMSLAYGDILHATESNLELQEQGVDSFGPRLCGLASINFRPGCQDFCMNLTLFEDQMSQKVFKCKY